MPRSLSGNKSAKSSSSSTNLANCLQSAVLSTSTTSVNSDRALLDADTDHRAIFPLRWISLVTGRHRRWLSDHPMRVGGRVAVVVEVLLLNHRRGHHRGQMGYIRKN